MADPRHEILVAVEPAVLSGLIVELLCQTGVPDVITVASNANAANAPAVYDAAVTTSPLPRDITAGVTIVLPDAEGGSGNATIQLPDGVSTFAITSPLQVLELLDRHCPAGRERSRGLTGAVKDAASLALIASTTGRSR